MTFLENSLSDQESLADEDRSRVYRAYEKFKEYGVVGEQTEEHSKNVARYATLLGHYAGCSNEQLQLLYYGGLIHDIGKRDEKVRTVLEKNFGETMDNADYEIIKTHAVKGVAELENEGITNPTLANLVLFHHKNYDGTGYPEEYGVEYADPLALILRVADSYEAAQTRPEFGNKNGAEIKEDILNHMGTYYHPELQGAFLSMCEALEENSDYTFPLLDNLQDGLNTYLDTQRPLEIRAA